MKYFELVSNRYSCDFLSLLILYEKTKEDPRRDPVRLEIFSEVKELKIDIDRRIRNKTHLFPATSTRKGRNWSLKSLSSCIKRE